MRRNHNFNLQKVVRSTRNDAYIEVVAQASYYPDSVRVFIPNEPFKKRLPGFDAPLQPASDMSLKLEKTSNETNLERSLRRTKKKIKDYVLCNDFDLFCTFTFAEDRQNINRSKKRMANWLKNQRTDSGKFRYLIVPEFHKDAASLHFHALFGSYKGKVVQSFNSNNGKSIIQNGREVFELPSYSHGFTNVKKIDADAVSRSKVAFYLQKYITKDMPVFTNKNRYWTSHGLKKPIVEDNPEIWYDIAPPDWEVFTDHGRIIEFNYGTHPLIDMFIEAKR